MGLHARGRRLHRRVVIYLAFFVAVTNGKASVSTQATVWFVVVCLALTGLAFIELAASSPTSGLHPGRCWSGWCSCASSATVACRSSSTLRDRPHRSHHLGRGTSWERVRDRCRGLRLHHRGHHAHLCSHRGLSQRQRQLSDGPPPSSPRSLDDIDLASVTSGHDSFQEIFGRGLPLVDNVLPASKIAVFARNAALERFALIASWPPDGGDVADLGRLPQLTETLVTDSFSLDRASLRDPGRLHGGR